MLAPPPLCPGDEIAVIASSGPFDRTLALRGLGWLAERYRVRFAPDLFERAGYLAGTDERRLGELAQALTGPARAVVAVRGGYGLSRIAHLVDWDRVLERPRWVVGFSDVTVLHAELWQRGLCSVHGPMVAAMGRGDAHARARWIATLEQPLAEQEFGRLSPYAPGTSEGPLVGGNLACLHACAAAGRLRIPEGSIVLLEDVGERPYRIDRMLTGLIAGRHLTHAAGIVLGEFTDCAPGPDGLPVEAVLRERLSTLGVPILAGLPVGHGRRNHALVLGAHTCIDASAGRCLISPANDRSS